MSSFSDKFIGLFRTRGQDDLTLKEISAQRTGIRGQREAAKASLHTFKRDRPVALAHGTAKEVRDIEGKIRDAELEIERLTEMDAEMGRLITAVQYVDGVRRWGALLQEIGPAMDEMEEAQQRLTAAQALFHKMATEAVHLEAGLAGKYAAAARVAPTDWHLLAPDQLPAMSEDVEERIRRHPGHQQFRTRLGRSAGGDPNQPRLIVNGKTIEIHGTWEESELQRALQLQRPAVGTVVDCRPGHVETPAR